MITYTTEKKGNKKHVFYHVQKKKTTHGNIFDFQSQLYIDFITIPFFLLFYMVVALLFVLTS